MDSGVMGGLSLIGVRGGIIVAAIVLILLVAVAAAVVARERYRAITRDLRDNWNPSPSFKHGVLDGSFRDTLQALQVYQGDINSQAIIDTNIQGHLRGLLLAERFVKAAVGLLIILGLVGTFLGLTLSIGQLVTLVAGDGGGDAQLAAQSLTAGLTEALSGMSVAFSTSLFGILAAIVMTIVNVFVSVSDARLSLAAELETYLDNTVLATVKGQSGAGLGLDQVVSGFGRSVENLHEVVQRFEASLNTLSSNTRDFQEFNHHLKDNIQRMSVSFSDLKQTLDGRKGPPPRT